MKPCNNHEEVIVTPVKRSYGENWANWRIGEVKMTRCPVEYGKQWRPKQGKSVWQKQKEEERKKEIERK